VVPHAVRIPWTKHQLVKILPNYPVQVFHEHLGKAIHYQCIKELERKFILCGPLEELAACINTNWFFLEDAKALYRGRFKEAL
jgi:hypothetical protein